MTWRPIVTAPSDRPFLARQDGEIYVATYTKIDPPQLRFRIHRRRVASDYRIIRVTLDGVQVYAQVPINMPWPEHYEHQWVSRTSVFQFAPTEWAEIPREEIEDE